MAPNQTSWTRRLLADPVGIERDQVEQGADGEHRHPERERQPGEDGPEIAALRPGAKDAVDPRQAEGEERAGDDHVRHVAPVDHVEYPREQELEHQGEERHEAETPGDAAHNSLFCEGNPIGPTYGMDRTIRGPSAVATPTGSFCQIRGAHDQGPESGDGVPAWP